MSVPSLITRTASTGLRKCSRSREEAESTVAAVRERAAAAAPASEPPQVDYTIAAAGDEVKLDLAIAFSCQAEKIIFELSLRNPALTRVRGKTPHR